MQQFTSGEQFKNLAAAERRAWKALEGRLPGNPEFDPAAWDAWRRALAAVAQEMDRQRNAVV